MFVSKERVIRNGYLVAFEGEEMSDEEAKARGLVEDEPKPKRRTRRKQADSAEEPEQ